METVELIEKWKKQTQDTDSIFKTQIDICSHADEILSEAQEEFRHLSSIINKKDLTFLTIACLLHGCAKYQIRRMRMMKDGELAEKNPLHNEEHSCRTGKVYYCTREEIISNPVPFDAIVLNPIYKTSRFTSFKPGISGLNHRFTAIGHDPVLGLIFGTANIMTGTITRYDFKSWHVNTITHERTKRNGKIAMEALDTICLPASTPYIFKSIYERIRNEGIDGWLTLGTALAKEIVHLMTDMPSTMSIPVPLISSISPEFAHKLSLYGVNTGTYLEGCITTKIINFTIAFLHRLFMEEGADENIYRARTAKIVTYADMIATGSDLAVTMYQSYLGQMEAMRKFDLGGYIVTLNKLVSSTHLVNEMECKYMLRKLDNQLLV